MRLSAATVGLLLGLALVIGSCGEGGSTASDRPVEGADEETSADSARAGRPGAATSSCRRPLGAFVASMADLRDKLARGLSYDQYLDEVAAMRANYARIRTDEIPLGCLFSVAGPAERAFNFYIEAANVWGDCLTTAGCRTRSIEPKLQHRWSGAADRLAIAQAALRG